MAQCHYNQADANRPSTYSQQTGRNEGLLDASKGRVRAGTFAVKTDNRSLASQETETETTNEEQGATETDDDITEVVYFPPPSSNLKAGGNECYCTNPFHEVPRSSPPQTRTCLPQPPNAAPSPRCQASSAVSSSERQQRVAGQMQSFFHQLYKNQKLTDLVVRLGERKYHIHKLTLLEHSDKYYNELVQSDRANCILHEIALKDTTPEAVEAVLDYLYTGHINLCPENVDDVLSCSLQLDLHQLTNLCLDLMRRLGCEREDKGGGVGQSGLDPTLLELACVDFCQFSSSLCFLQLDVDQVCALLGDDRLAVECELDVFCAALRWLDFRYAERQLHALRIMDCIRFGLLFPSELLNNVESQSHLMRLPDFREMVYQAYRYHALALSKSQAAAVAIVPPRKRSSCCLLQAPNQYQYYERAGTTEDHEIRRERNFVGNQSGQYQLQQQQQYPQLPPKQQQHPSQQQRQQQMQEQQFHKQHQQRQQQQHAFYHSPEVRDTKYDKHNNTLTEGFHGQEQHPEHFIQGNYHQSNDNVTFDANTSVMGNDVQRLREQPHTHAHQEQRHMHAHQEQPLPPEVQLRLLAKLSAVDAQLSQLLQSQLIREKMQPVQYAAAAPCNAPCATPEDHYSNYQNPMTEISPYCTPPPPLKAAQQYNFSEQLPERQEVKEQSNCRIVRLSPVTPPDLPPAFPPPPFIQENCQRAGWSSESLKPNGNVINNSFGLQEKCSQLLPPTRQMAPSHYCPEMPCTLQHFNHMNPLVCPSSTPNQLAQIPDKENQTCLTNVLQMQLEPNQMRDILPKLPNYLNQRINQLHEMLGQNGEIASTHCFHAEPEQDHQPTSLCPRDEPNSSAEFVDRCCFAEKQTYPSGYGPCAHVTCPPPCADCVERQLHQHLRAPETGECQCPLPNGKTMGQSVPQARRPNPAATLPCDSSTYQWSPTGSKASRWLHRKQQATGAPSSVASSQCHWPAPHRTSVVQRCVHTQTQAGENQCPVCRPLSPTRDHCHSVRSKAEHESPEHGCVPACSPPRPCRTCPTATSLHPNSPCSTNRKPHIMLVERSAPSSPCQQPSSRAPTPPPEWRPPRCSLFPSPPMHPPARILTVGGTDLCNIHPTHPGCQLLAFQRNKTKWSSLSHLPLPRNNHSALAVGKMVYVIGGALPIRETDDVFAKPTSTVMSLDWCSGEWCMGAAMKEARLYFASATCGGLIFVFGGQGLGNSVLDSVECYDPVYDKWHERGVLKMARVGACAAAHRNRIFLVGGYAWVDGEATTLSNVAKYDPATDCWMELSPLRFGLCYAGLVESVDRLYLVGGAVCGCTPCETTLTSVSAILLYDSCNDVWLHAGDLRTPRHDAGVAALGSKLYVAGGLTQGNRPLASVECYDTSHGFLLAKVADLPQPSAGCACCTIPPDAASDDEC